MTQHKILCAAGQQVSFIARKRVYPMDLRHGSAQLPQGGLEGTLPRTQTALKQQVRE